MDLRIGPERNTYTIIGYCPRSQRLGVAITTFSLAVGGYCPRVEADVGAVASQAYADPRLIVPALELLKEGIHPTNALKELSRTDSFFSYRQIGLVDANGNAAAHTGEKTTAWKGHICGHGYVAMGNCLSSERTVREMSERFRQNPGLELEERLLSALEAGRAPPFSAGSWKRRRRTERAYERTFSRPDCLSAGDLPSCRSPGRPASQCRGGITKGI